MACVTTHNQTSKVQGPGVCCAALGSQTPVIGLRFGATDKNGKCIVCEIKASTSKKNPGAKVFKKGKSCANGTCICPSSSVGCCSLAA